MMEISGYATLKQCEKHPERYCNCEGYFPACREAQSPSPTAKDDGREFFEAFHREVWGWLLKRGLVSNDDDEWAGFTAVIEEHEEEIEAAAMRAAQPVPGDMVSSAIADIAAERKRQTSVEGWTPEHDDQHTRDQFATAAGCYILHEALGSELELFWPWAPEWWKPTDRRSDLVKAGALIVAEIDRLDRLTTQVSSPSTGGANTPDAEPCGLASPSYHDCPNMKEIGGGMEGERYRCAVCGKGYFLDYEDMK
ncbi:MAG: hypothetical protein E5W09_22580 [Mesorhizobium sp.]|nr:MAG: hypothetical protein E5W09_22580 [Mesorhizobium sp.]